MKVDLIEYTGRGMNDPWYAAALLIWAKNTRVQMSPGNFDAILQWPEEQKLTELEYIANTLPSSWEHIDFVFLISGVTRAFTHQLVRTRTASYSQQAMQVLRMDQGAGWNYHTGMTIARNPEAQKIYDNCMAQIADAYKTLVNIDGIHTEDARGVLPTNILTNIVMKANLRTLCDLLRKRASPRNQGARPGDEGEWAVCHREMKARMVEALPWVDMFLNRTADKYAQDAYLLLEKIEDKKLRVEITKRIDAILTNVGAGN